MVRYEEVLEKIDEKYREKFEELVSLRTDLLEQIGALGQRCLRLDKNAGEELADIGTENFTRETTFNMINAEEEELREIDIAIEKMIDGTYGLCEDCNKPIETGRLAARPFARYCITDKERREMEAQGYDYR